MDRGGGGEAYKERNIYNRHYTYNCTHLFARSRIFIKKSIKKSIKERYIKKRNSPSLTFNAFELRIEAQLYDENVREMI